MRQQWEYLTLTVCLPAYRGLNTLGKEGWELISAIPVLGGGEENEVILIFKRQRDYQE